MSNKDSLRYDEKLGFICDELFVERRAVIDKWASKHLSAEDAAKQILRLNELIAGVAEAIKQEPPPSPYD